MALIQKIGIGLSVQILGLLLTFSGYQSIAQCSIPSLCLEQPPTAQITIRICMGLIPATLVVLGLLRMRRWPDKGAHLQIQATDS